MGGKRIEKLNEQLNSVIDPEGKVKIEKRIKNWEKVKKGTEYVKSFLKGAKLGLLGSAIFSGAFMGGHGLIWNQAEIPTGTIIEPGSASARIPAETPITPEAPVVDTLPSVELPHETYDLFANGQVNLPGSAMDGWQLANIPKGYEGVPINDIPAELFANSGSKAFHIFLENARTAGYSNTDISSAISKMGTLNAHRVLRDGAYTGSNILQSMIDGGWLAAK